MFQTKMCAIGQKKKHGLLSALKTQNTDCLQTQNNRFFVLTRRKTVRQGENGKPPSLL
jgi:hypothetical protein